MPNPDNINSVLVRSVLNLYEKKHSAKDYFNNESITDLASGHEKISSDVHLNAFYCCFENIL